MVFHSSLRKGLLAGVAVGAMALYSAGTANAVTSLFQSGVNEFQDDNREYLIDRSFFNELSPAFGIPGQIEVGDSLRGHFFLNDLNGTGLFPTNPAGREWAGVFQTMVIAKIPTGVGNQHVFLFGPDPAFEASICGGQVDCQIDLGALDPNAATPGPGALMVMFSNPPGSGTVQMNFGGVNDPLDPSFQQDDGTTGPNPDPADVSIGPYVSEETLIATATTGTYFWTLGFSGDPLAAEGWEAFAFSDNILTSFTSTGTFGFFNIGLSCISGDLGQVDCAQLETTRNTTFGILANGLVQVEISGSLLGVGPQGTGVNTPFEARSQMSGSFDFTPMPEPASLGLLGLGLLGMGYLNRRQRSKAKRAA